MSLLLQQAFEAYQKDDIEKAVEYCYRAQKEDPDNAKLYQLFHLIARKKGDRETADAHIQTAIKLDPEDAELQNSLGNHLRQTGKPKAAEAAYRKALALAPNYQKAAANLGYLLLARQNPLDAVNVFKEGLKNAAPNNSLFRGWLIALKNGGNPEEARKHLGQLQQNPENSFLAAQIHMDCGDFQSATRLFSVVFNHPQLGADAFANVLQCEWMMRGLDGVTGVTKALMEGPKIGPFYLVAANFLMTMKDYDYAGEVLDNCEKQFGKQSEISGQRALLALEQGKASEALKHAKAAIKSSQKNLATMNMYAKSLLANGKFKEALKIAEEGRAHQPNNQLWITLQATALRGLGDADFERLYNYERFVQAFDIEIPAEFDSAEDFNAKLAEEIAAYHRSSRHPIGQSLRDGIQTSVNLRFAQSPAIQAFFKSVRLSIAEYIGSIGTDQDHPLTARAKEDFRVTEAWSVRLSGDGFHVNHIHPNGWLSSAYYVEVPGGIETAEDRSGWIKFGEPSFTVPGQDAQHWVMPKPGRLVLFPSYMWHGTVPIKDGQTRLTLPFDVVPD